MKQYYVYILANKSDTLYIGVTSDLVRRVYEHKNKLHPGFTEKYNIDRLVYYELHEDISQAITREKQMKKWKRQYKLNLITDFNPAWLDLYDTLIG